MNALETYVQWCNQNQGRRYPLASSATGVDDSGVALPDYAVVDLGVTTHPDLMDDIRISDVRLSPGVRSIALCRAQVPILVGTWDSERCRNYNALPLTPMFPGVAGWVVFGDHEVNYARTHRFSTPEQSGLEPRVVRRGYKPGVVGIQRAADSGSLNMLEGIVRLVDGPGIQIRGFADLPHLVEIGLEAGLCQDFLPTSYRRPMIREISGAVPDADGYITLEIV